MFFFTFDLFTLIIGGAIALAVLWVISTINGFKRREIKIEEALSGIEVALTKRYDMLTKLWTPPRASWSTRATCSAGSSPCATA